MKLSYPFKFTVSLLCLLASVFCLSLTIANLQIQDEQQMTTAQSLTPSSASMLELKNYPLPLLQKNANANAVKKSATEEEVPCDFKKDIFHQWSYLLGRRTSCVYR